MRNYAEDDRILDKTILEDYRILEKTILEDYRILENPYPDTYSQNDLTTISKMTYRLI